jgi:MFS transporter, DHA2 family, methylenomycin A resistance protein
MESIGKRPRKRRSFTPEFKAGGRMTGLQRVADGFTLMFAALLLSAGALSDRVGAGRAFGSGLGALSLVTRRLIFFVDVPVGAGAR